VSALRWRKSYEQSPSNGEWASELALACYSLAITQSNRANDPTQDSRKLLTRGRDLLIKVQSQSPLSPADKHRLQEIQGALGGQ
jgi:hypothetical protein